MSTLLEIVKLIFGTERNPVRVHFASLSYNLVNYHGRKDIVTKAQECFSLRFFPRMAPSTVANNVISINKIRIAECKNGFQQ